MVFFCLTEQAVCGSILVGERAILAPFLVVVENNRHVRQRELSVSFLFEQIGDTAGQKRRPETLRVEICIC